MRAACFLVPEDQSGGWRSYIEHDRRVYLELASAGDEKVPGFSDTFLPELYHRLFSREPDPVEAKERAPEARLRAALHKIISKLPEVQTLRRMTVADPMWSGMATMILARSLIGALPDPDPYGQPLSDMDATGASLKAVRALEQDMKPEGREALQERIGELLMDQKEASDAVNEYLEEIDECDAMMAANVGIAEAVKKIEETAKNLSALGYGDESGMHTHLAPDVAIEVSKRIASNETLRKIIELSGRMTMTARAKRAARTREARSEVVGVKPTSELSRILPTELSALASPDTEAALYARLLNGAALGYDLAGKDKESRGPIIVVIDQSASMQGDKDVWAKAIAIAMLDAAVAEKRSFGFICYDHRILDAKLFEKPTEANPKAILDLLSTYPDGGTEFLAPLSRAVSWVEQEAAAVGKVFRKADICHITDGEGGTAGAADFMARCVRAGCVVYGISIGGNLAALKQWSSEVAFIRDLKSDAAAVDLVFDHI